MKPFLFTLMVLWATACCGQQINVFYLKNNGSYVNNVDSAEYTRVINAPDSGSALYKVSEYYKNGKKKLTGTSSAINPPRFKGPCLTFYPNGNRQGSYTYDGGVPVGSAYDYYPNGKLYRMIKYPDSVVRGNNHFKDNYLIIDNLDSVGKVQVAESKGYYRGFDEKFSYIKEQGPVNNGLREGAWKGEDKTLKLTFIETYKNNELLSGSATDSSSLTTTYSGARMTSPQFEGGYAAFSRYIRDHIIYPNDARAHDIEGIVILQFVLEKDGSVTEIKVLRSVSKSLDEEAVRVIRESPKWIPGTRFGRPVRVSYAVPVNFKLQ
ncbi:energy transducer TonB [Mucilaginibacter psychrotolerans]|uniref:TonB family protein n=1 Tax=Mucilaginibacter psychrotolerans TaxID=1524096 RepID=A0A4Y8SC46_9SPHI|nr:energy transducer TonB [Mucilaginibacter psychrotolerans]TFF36160.1 TonB family protein [Mucilaginibacter psychrotolerans]